MQRNSGTYRLCSYFIELPRITSKLYLQVGAYIAQAHIKLITSDKIIT